MWRDAQRPIGELPSNRPSTDVLDTGSQVKNLAIDGKHPIQVVRQGTSATLLHRQPGLGAVERLYLRLLVDREHNGVGRRVDVKADDFAQFWGRTPGPSTA